MPTTDVRKSVDAADLNMKNKSLDNCRRVRVRVNHGKDKRSIKSLTINVNAKGGPNPNPNRRALFLFSLSSCFSLVPSSLTLSATLHNASRMRSFFPSHLPLKPKNKRLLQNHQSCAMSDQRSPPPSTTLSVRELFHGRGVHLFASSCSLFPFLLCLASLLAGGER